MYTSLYTLAMYKGRIRIVFLWQQHFSAIEHVGMKSSRIKHKKDLFVLFGLLLQQTTEKIFLAYISCYLG